VTDQPPSQPPAHEPEGDTPAALVSDDAPTQVRTPDTAAASQPPPAPAPPAAFTPGDGPTVPPTAPPPPRVADLPSGEGASTGPSGLAAVFPPEQPERALGAAFGGGIVLALILKRLAR
jgi:hypothetical protein